MVKEVNKHLKAEVKADEVSFTFFRQFPYASLILHNVQVQDPLRTQTNLLQSERIELLFHPIKALKGNFVLKKGIVVNSDLRIFINQNGEENYQITTSSDSDSSTFHFDLGSLILDKFRFEYLDLKNQQHYQLSSEQANAKGSIQDEVLSFSINSNLKTDFIKVNKDTFLQQLALEISSDISIHLAKDYLTFKKGVIIYEESVLQTNGLVSYNTNKNLNVKLLSEQSQITDLLNLVPGGSLNLPKDLKLESNLRFEAQLKGDYHETENLDIIVNFEADKGKISYPEYDIQAKEVQIIGSLKQQNRVAILSLSKFRISDGQHFIAGDIQSFDFKKAKAKGHIDAALNLKHLTPFLDLDSLTSINGEMELHLDFNEFLIKNLSSPPVLLGTMNISNANIRLKKENLDIEEVFASVRFDRLNWIVNELKGNSTIGPFNINGNISNLLPSIFDQNETSYAQINFTSDKIDLNKLKVRESQSSSGGNPFNLILRSQLDISSFVFEKFSAENIKADMIYQNGIFDVNNIQLSTMDGSVNGQLILESQKNGDLKFYTNTDLENVDITKLFATFNNFGQDDLRSDHISGIITSSTEVSGVLNSELQPYFNSLQAVSDMKVSNGRLYNYPTLMELSEFVLIDDLEDIQFDDLENKITIQDGKIIIPEMYVNTNAYDLWISGTQTFTDEIDYHFKIAINQVLSSKAKRKKENVTFGKSEGAGINLFIHLSGTTDDPEFRYETELSREQIKGNLSSEKKLIDGMIREELGLKVRKDSIKTSSEHFEIEWDDD